ncbi:hypothetical protein NPIL_523841, partial [Nephila pilipes]
MQRAQFRDETETKCLKPDRVTKVKSREQETNQEAKVFETTPSGYPSPIIT